MSPRNREGMGGGSYMRLVGAALAFNRKARARLTAALAAKRKPELANALATAKDEEREAFDSLASALDAVRSKMRVARGSSTSSPTPAPTTP